MPLSLRKVGSSIVTFSRAFLEVYITLCVERNKWMSKVVEVDKFYQSEIATMKSEFQRSVLVMKGRVSFSISCTHS